MMRAIGNRKLGFARSSDENLTSYDSINLILTKYLNIQQDYFYLDKNLAIDIISSLEKELEVRLLVVENNDNYKAKANANNSLMKYVYVEYYVKTKSKHVVINKLKGSETIIEMIDFL